jgi:VWFA-related protein
LASVSAFRTFALCLLPCALVAAQQRPTFRSNVNMLAVDVMVVDKTGEPILGLQPGDFEVKINNQVRRVTSADLVRYTAEDKPVSGVVKGLAPPPASFIRTPGQIPTDSRVFIIAVDDASFLTGELRGAVLGAQKFIDNLRSNDMVGLYVYPFQAPRLALTHDHKAVRDALGTLIGRREPNIGEFDISPSEVIEIANRRGVDVLERVQSRECPPTRLEIDPSCRKRVEMEGALKASYFEIDGARRLVGLATLYQDLAWVPGRKNVVVLSGGLLSAPYGQPDVRIYMKTLGAQAARANIGTYVLHLDETFNDAFSATTMPSKRPADRFNALMADESVWSDGLEKLAAESGGTYLSVKAGTGDFVFNRILRETMAYYLLGVEPTPDDWNGKRLMVKVKASVKDATVRALREVIAK